MPQDLRVFYCS